jgi:hypothetical protein
MVGCPLTFVWASANTLVFFAEGGGENGGRETRNERALFVFNRVQNKLTGMAHFLLSLTTEC